jgi:hypothetical protein
MKSAYELAMERLNKSSPAVKLTAEQKKQLAELDSQYAAKVAEREITLNDEIRRLAQSGDREKMGEIQQQLARDRKSLQAELESKKEKVRDAKS